MSNNNNCFYAIYYPHGYVPGYFSRDMHYYSKPAPMEKAALFRTYEEAEMEATTHSEIVKVNITVSHLTDEEKRSFVVERAKEKVQWAKGVLEEAEANLDALGTLEEDSE